MPAPPLQVTRQLEEKVLGLVDLPIVAPWGGRSLLQHPGCLEGRALRSFVQFNLKGIVERSAGDVEEWLLGTWGWAALKRDPDLRRIKLPPFLETSGNVQRSWLVPSMNVAGLRLLSCAPRASEARPAIRPAIVGCSR